MKRFGIFRPGRHTAMSGVTLDFVEDQLRAAVDAYDPALHEAPIVVGHPKDNGPAYGWVKALSFNESTGEIDADPHQVDQAFAEMVRAGRFKKRSVSWYLPDSPSNPKPGTLYLRHVAFLGAQPPAVKGLKDAEFSEADGVVEFSDYEPWGFRTIASMFRGLREWLIAENGVEEADKVLPNLLIGTADDAAKAAQEPTPDITPAFSEDDPMTIAELQAQVAALTAENAALKANADFAEREANLAAREAAIAEAEKRAARATIEARVDAAIQAGRLLPAQRKRTIDFAAMLTDGELTIDFGEGDKAVRVSQRDAYLRQIETGPRVVEYGELSGNDGRDTSNLPSLSEIQAGLLAQVAGAAK